MAGSSGTLQDYSVFSPQFITKVINDIVVDPQTFGVIDKWIPSRDQEPRLGDEIKWDIHVTHGGMTQPAHEDATSPLIGGMGARQMKWTPPHFREKKVLGGTDIRNMRKLGTLNDMRTLGEEVAKHIQVLRSRIDNRIYWLKWEAVQNAAAFNIRGNNITVPLDYSDYGYHGNVGVFWDVGGATIIDDIIGFISQFRQSACIPTDAFFGTQVLQALLADATLATLVQGQVQRRVAPDGIYSPMVGQAGIITFLQELFGNVAFHYYPFGPVVTLTTINPIGAGAGVTYAVEGDLSLWAVGDVATCTYPNGTQVAVTIQAAGIDLVNNAITLNAGAVAIPMGSQILKRMEFLHYDQFVMFSEMPPGQMGGQVQSEFVTVSNFHGEGGIPNMQSGIVGRTINKEKDDPPSVEMIASFSGGVVVYHPEGCWLSYKVLT